MSWAVYYSIKDLDMARRYQKAGDPVYQDSVTKQWWGELPQRYWTRRGAQKYIDRYHPKSGWKVDVPGLGRALAHYDLP